MLARLAAVALGVLLSVLLLALVELSLRAFGVANTSEGSGFARLIATGELRDNLALEGSIGWFVGEGRDLVGRFADSDFIYLRLKHYF